MNTKAEEGMPSAEGPSYDSFFIPHDGILPADPPQNGEPPVAPTTPEPPQVDPGTQTTDTDDLQRSTLSNLLLHYRDEKGILPKEFEIPDDLDPETGAEKLWEGVEKAVLEKHQPTFEALKQAEYNKLVAKGFTEEQIERALFFSEHLAEGGSEEAVSTISYFDQMSKVEPQNEAEELEVLRRLEDVRGQDPDKVEVYLEKNFLGEEKAEARKRAVSAALKAFEEFRDAEIAADRARAKAEKEAADRRKAEERKTLEKAIEAGFMGVKPPAEDLEKLKKAMFDIADYRHVPGPKGAKPIPETAETKAWRQVFANPELRAAFGYAAVFGLDKLVNLLTKKESKSFLEAIDKSNQAPAAGAILNRPAPVVQPTQDGGFILKV